MEKAKTTGIKILGWFFIVLSFPYLITFLQIISSYNKLYSLSAGLPEKLLSVFLITTTSSDSIGFFSFL